MELQDKEVNEIFQTLEQQPTMDGWLVLHRGFDETQMSLQYGASAQILRDWSLDRIKNNPRYNAQEREDLCRLVRKMPYGSCSVLVSSAWMQFRAPRSPVSPVSPVILGSADSPGGFRLLSPVCALQRNTARCIRAGLDAVVPSISFDRIKEVSSHLNVVVINLLRDSASANLLMSREVNATMPDNVLVWSWACDIHLLFRAIASLLDDVSLMGPLFSLSKLVRLTDNWTRLVRSVATWVHQHLDVVTDFDPNPAWNQFARTTLKHTVLRDLEVTGARGHTAAPQPRRRPISNFERRRRCCDQLLLALNGDWTQPYPRHFCRDQNCPHARLVVEAVVESVHTLFPSVPAENKWASISSSRAFAAFLFQLCRVGTAFAEECAESRLGTQEDGPADEDAANFKVVNARRLAKAKQFLSNFDSLMMCSIMNIISGPADSCLQFLDYADAKAAKQPADSPGSSGSPGCPFCPTRNTPSAPAPEPTMLQTMMGPNGPLVTMQHELADLLRPTSDLSLLLSAYEPAAGAPEQLSAWWLQWGTRSLGWVLNLAAGTYWRCECRYKLLPQMRLVDAMWAQDPLSAAQGFLKVPSCCRDEFCDKLHALLGGDASGLVNGPIHEALHALLSRMEVTTASLERRHATNRQIARPGSTRSPISLERLRHESLLRDAMSEHTEAGRPDLSILNREVLRRRGLLTVADARKSKKRRRLPVPLNPALLFANCWRKQEGRREQLNCVQANRRASEEWRLLPAREKERWRCKWRMELANARAKATSQSQQRQSRQSPPQGGPAVAQFQAPLARVSGDGWPLSPVALSDYIAKYGRRDATRSGRPGPRNTGRTVLKTDATRVLVADPRVERADMGPQRECWRVHPGICRSNADHERALMVAGNLHKVFSQMPRDSVMGSYIRLLGQREGEEDRSMYLCTCMFRRARPAALVFVECSVIQTADDGAPVLDIKVDGDRLFFLLGYEVALAFCCLDQLQLNIFKVSAPDWATKTMTWGLGQQGLSFTS